MTYYQPEGPQPPAHAPASHLPANRPLTGYDAAGQPAWQPAPYGPAGGHYGQVVAARPPRSAGAAVALELVLGIFGIFGVGNIYAGRAGGGVALMLSFCVLCWINFALIFIVVGVVTMPLTWVAYLIAGPLLAARAVETYNTGY